MSGIYIHIPFCNSKCFYCNFYSIVNNNLRTDYIDALVKEITVRKNEIVPFKVETLYFGGGTPSLLSIKELEIIINALSKNYNLSFLQEFTIEANPEGVTKKYVTELKKLGVNRLSIGIQSFNDRILRLLNRKHSANSAKNSICIALDGGFSNINIDLIYGINARSEKEWEEDVETAFSFPIKHLSAYSLTIEENTVLAKKIEKKINKQPDDNKAISNYYTLIEKCNSHNFIHYEISNFSLAGYYSKHNFSYWQHVPYLGFGAAAHSFYGNRRKWNIANVNKYISGIRNLDLIYEDEILTDKDRFYEYILIHLRTNAGIDLNEIIFYFGQKAAKHIISKLESINTKFYYKANNKIVLSEEGFLLADFITEKLL